MLPILLNPAKAGTSLLHSRALWNFCSATALGILNGETDMQAAIDRVMQAYGMMVNLTPDEERNAREKVAAFLATADAEDENSLAVEGLKYLRQARP